MHPNMGMGNGLERYQRPGHPKLQNSSISPPKITAYPSYRTTGEYWDPLVKGSMDRFRIDGTMFKEVCNKAGVSDPELVDKVTKYIEEGADIRWQR